MRQAIWDNRTHCVRILRRCKETQNVSNPSHMKVASWTSERCPVRGVDNVPNSSGSVKTLIHPIRWIIRNLTLWYEGVSSVYYGCISVHNLSIVLTLFWYRFEVTETEEVPQLWAIVIIPKTKGCATEMSPMVEHSEKDHHDSNAQNLLAARVRDVPPST